MENLEVTSMSSRGQVVIPQDLREKMGLMEGDKFVVMGNKDCLIFQKIKVPSFRGFDELLRKTQEFAKRTDLRPQDVEKAISKARGQ